MSYTTILLLAMLVAFPIPASSQVVFRNVTLASGISTPDDNSSSFTHSWADFDNDGLWDLFIARGDIGYFQTPQVYRNLGGGKFLDITTTSFPPFPRGYYAHMCFGDFDNDGFVDVYQDAFVSSENRLWKNNGDLTFKDVSSKMMNPGGRTVGTVWSDFDEDGFVDLLVNAQAGQGTLCYHNNAGATLDATSAFIVNKPIGDILLTTDINQDGWPDYYFADHASPDSLFLTKSGVASSFSNEFLIQKFNNSDNRMTASFADLDNDGYPEMLLADNGKLVVWHNDSGRNYTDWTSKLKLDSAEHGDHRMSFIQDIDNDGFEDILLYNNLDSSQIWYGSAQGFTKSTLEIAMNTNSVPSSFSWTDFDNDGFLDLMDVSRGITELWHNEGNQNRWLSASLRGHRANSLGIGATVIAYTDGHKQYREIGFYQGYYGYQPLMAHFGFGTPGCEESAYIDSVVIIWQPGVRQVLRNVRYNQTMLVDQDSGIVRTFERPYSSSNGYVYPVPVVSSTVDINSYYVLPVSIKFPPNLQVDTIKEARLTFSLIYNSAVIDINPTKVAQRYTPPAGWAYQSSRLVPDTLSITISDTANAKLTNPQSVGTLRFDTYADASGFSLISLSEVLLSSRDRSFSFCMNWESSVITDLRVVDSSAISSVASACPNTTDMSIIPNPSNGGGFRIHFPLREDANANVRVVDLLGRVVYSSSLANVPSSAGVAELVVPPGVIARQGSYVVEVNTSTQYLVSRLVVTR